MIHSPSGVRNPGSPRPKALFSGKVPKAKCQPCPFLPAYTTNRTWMNMEHYNPWNAWCSCVGQWVWGQHWSIIDIVHKYLVPNNPSLGPLCINNGP